MLARMRIDAYADEQNGFCSPKLGVVTQKLVVGWTLKAILLIFLFFPGNAFYSITHRTIQLGGY
jgi:hypothetical protein